MKSFNLFFLKLLRAGLRKKKRLVFSYLAVNIFLALQIPHLKTFYSTDDLQEEKINSLQEWREFKRNFRENQSSFILISPAPPRKFFSEVELCYIRNRTAKLPSSSELVQKTQSAFDIRQAYLDTRSRLFFPLLLDLNCEAPQRSASEMLETFKKLDVADWETSLFSKNRNDIAIMVSYESTDATKAFPTSRIQDVWNYTRQSLEKIKSVNVWAMGGADYQLWVHKARSDTAWVYLAVLVGIVVGLRILLGTWLSGVIYVTGLISSLSMIYGLKALLGSATDLLSDTMVPLLAIATLEDFVFVSFVQLKDHFHWRKSLRRLLAPSFWTSLTTFIGFGSLIISDLNIIQRLGLWTAIGSMMEWLVIFYITPLFLSLFWKKKNWVDMNRAVFKTSGTKFFLLEPILTKLLNPLCKISFVAIPLLIFSSPPLRIQDSLEEVFRKNHPFSQGLEYLQTTRGWKDRIELKVPEAFPNERLDALIQDLQASGLISNFDRAQKTKQFVVRSLPNDFIPLAHRLAETSDFISSFYGLDGSERVSFYLKDGSTKSFEQLRSVLGQSCSAKECQLVGSLYTKSQFTQVVSETFLKSSILSLFLIVIILLLLSVALKRTHEILPMIIASLWAPLLLLSIIKTFEVSINFITCIVITVLVGLAGDNVIQFLFADKKSTLAGIGHLKGGAACCFILMALVSLLFLLAPFQPIRMMGVLTATGFVAILIGDILVLKILLHMRVKKLAKD